MDIKVRLLDGNEEKGVAQVEQELLEKHDKEINNEGGGIDTSNLSSTPVVEEEFDEQKAKLLNGQ